MALVGPVQVWRAHVVAAPPELHLLFPVLLGRLLLVQALQRAVVALVEPPASFDGDPGKAHLGERELSRRDGPQQKRLVYDFGPEPRLFHETSRLRRLAGALLGQRNVVPPGEEVLEVPRALTVAEEDQSAGGPAASDAHRPLRSP